MKLKKQIFSGISFQRAKSFTSSFHRWEFFCQQRPEFSAVLVEKQQLLEQHWVKVMILLQELELEAEIVRRLRIEELFFPRQKMIERLA